MGWTRNNTPDAPSHRPGRPVSLAAFHPRNERYSLTSPSPHQLFRSDKTMRLRLSRNARPTPAREECSSRLQAPSLTDAEKPMSMAIAIDIDEFVSSPWIGLHYRHELLLHHRHELLEYAPNQGIGHGLEAMSDASAALSFRSAPDGRKSSGD